ncbi:hypothetical protein MPLDJ20_80228 [Mesorhizobium plurifarium]|uniref:Sulfotransferase domain-containing protein n=1 Tax=Mesorhizobium plurifarium TaxID=69974 RepID=A0A090FQH3_MESPL|nr:hypothetical protein MPLDJ20_80228 [Mesorhizobium plurifarium]
MPVSPWISRWIPDRLRVLPINAGSLGDGYQEYRSFKSKLGKVSNRAIVISIPKAGTYLVAKMLENLGLVDLEVHLWETGFSDYRGRSIVEKLEKARELTCNIPLSYTTGMIQRGQFAVGHLAFDVQTEMLVQPFAKILCIRELRSALCSYMRFEQRRLVADPHRSPTSRKWIEKPNGPERMLAFLEVHGANYIAMAERIAGWAASSDVVTVRFEELLGDQGPVVQQEVARRISESLGVTADVGARSLRDALNTTTLTYSGNRTDITKYWTPAAERRFEAAGGHNVSELLGY